MAAIAESSFEFYCPKVMPKVLLAKGPSGWSETFQRAVVDAELKAFMAPAPIDDVVDLFIKIRQSQDEPTPTNWHTITGFIGRTMGCSPLAVPRAVGIAFWARVVIATTERHTN